MTFAVECDGLSKSYGELLAVDQLCLRIDSGAFFGLLGPNGSGKTTTLQMLSTLSRPDTGAARIYGLCVQSSAVAVRAAVGIVFQESALDRNLTVWENLTFSGALYGLDSGTISQRAGELLELFDLSGRRDTPVAALSGGMRRAVDIARGVLHHPRLLFLDEPTTGLDIINRRAIWRFISKLRSLHGMTVLLTTHYLEEAGDCDRVAFLRKGSLTEEGVPQELIAGMGEYMLEVELTAADDAEAKVKAQLQPVLGEPLREGNSLSFRVADGKADLAGWQDSIGLVSDSLRLRKPDLNDVYLWHNRSLVEGKPQ
ncbi:MAG: ABC transporter ATP-binding protein [Candidatus Porifericomitaceae bacterium WSBS_2022_MAG_OTU9]